MSRSVEIAHRLGFSTKTGRAVWAVPVAITTGMTGLTVLLLFAGLIQIGYFSPYVAAIAFVAAKVCVRAGLLAAILSILLWDFFVVPPVLTLTLPTASEVTAWLAALAAGVLVAPRLSREEPAKRDGGNPSTGLPFVTTKKPTHNGADHMRMASCWDVERTGDHSADDYYGRELGRLWVDQRQAGADGVPPLSFIVNDMLEDGEFSGVEAGFLNAVERAVVDGRELPLGMHPSIPDHEPHDSRAQGEVIQ